MGAARGGGAPGARARAAGGRAGRRAVVLGGGAAAPAGLGAALAAALAAARPARAVPLELGEEEWRQRLSKESFRVMRESGTERPGSSPLNKEKRDGTYWCAACDKPLFTSAAKFNSGTGWPSFYEPVSGAVDGFDPGLSYTLYDRKCKEIRCHNCGGHLGHVFSDGAIWGVPTGQRYCMNGVALRFEEKRPGA